MSEKLRRVFQILVGWVIFGGMCLAMATGWFYIFLFLQIE